MSDLEPKNIVSVIEAYRCAYMAHRNPGWYSKNRYKPQVGNFREFSPQSGESYTVYLHDTWVEFGKPGGFRIGQHLVDNSRFSSRTLSMALQELLNFMRIQFMNDQLFEQIQSEQN